MLERTGAIDVYFEDEIEILVENPHDYSVELLKEVLDSKEIKYSHIERASRT